MGHWSRRFIQWIEGIRMERASGDMALQIHLEELCSSAPDHCQAEPCDPGPVPDGRVPFVGSLVEDDSGNQYPDGHDLVDGIG